MQNISFAEPNAQFFNQMVIIFQIRLLILLEFAHFKWCMIYISHATPVILFDSVWSDLIFNSTKWRG